MSTEDALALPAHIDDQLRRLAEAPEGALAAARARLAEDPDAPFLALDIQALEAKLAAVAKLRARVDEAPEELRSDGFWRSVTDRLNALLVPDVPVQAIDQLARDLQVGYGARSGPVWSRPKVDPFERGKLEQAALLRIDERCEAIDRELKVADRNLAQSRGASQDERLLARSDKARMEQGLLKAARFRLVRAYATADPAREVLEEVEKVVEILLSPTTGNDRRRDQLAVLDNLVALASGVEPRVKGTPRKKA